MSFGIDDVHPFHQLIISVVLGLLVGLQRQWVDSPLGGIRTFSLISLLGTACALLAEKYGAWMIVAGFLGVIAAMAAGHLSKQSGRAPEHSGLVTELAMLLMYCSGVFVHLGPIWLGAAVAGLLAVILHSKMELHVLAKRFSESEITAIMQFVLISLVIFPIVPNQVFGPLQVLNPRDIWLMVVIIVAVSLSGYIAYKFVGDRAGVILGGVLGGVISSTATTMSYSRRSKEAAGAVPRSAIVVGIAWTVVYIRLLLEVIAAAPTFHAAWLPLGIMFLASALSTLWLWRRLEDGGEGMPAQDNPTELKTALTFGALYAAILFAVTFAKTYSGSGGLTLVAILSGITDMDAITLSTSRLVATGKLLPQEGWPIIIVAGMSNVFFKGAIAGFVGGRGLFKALLMPWLCSLAAGTLLLVAW